MYSKNRCFLMLIIALSFIIVSHIALGIFNIGKIKGENKVWNKAIGLGIAEWTLDRKTGEAYRKFHDE